MEMSLQLEANCFAIGSNALHGTATEERRGRHARLKARKAEGTVSIETWRHAGLETNAGIELKAVLIRHPPRKLAEARRTVLAARPRSSSILVPAS